MSLWTPIVAYMALNENYKEILRLAEMLSKADIPHTLARIYDGWQICYPTKGKGRVMDTIEHTFSLGVQFDRLEILGLTENGQGVEGGLTDEEVFRRIAAHYAGRR